MDGVGSAASIIAIVELSAKVASLLLQYSTAVKNAKTDIQRILGELEPLSQTLDGVRRLLDGPGGAKLDIIQRFRASLEGCASQLAELESRLTETLRGKQGSDSKSARLMNRFGIRAMKWPFETKEIDGIVKKMERYRDSLAAGLMVQTVQILSTTQNDVLSRLPNVVTAAFDSHANEHGAKCHSQTRVELRREVLEWADNPDGKCIYWLNGMAGTGKSTISRTIAKSFSDKRYLGGSFFFKRGERDRGNASQLFTTIAYQLVAKEPKLAPSVADALDKDPTLASKPLTEQFEKLVLKPLEKLEDMQILVFVFDALDECEGDEDVRRIISLISKGSQLRSIQMRAFLTSRPELPIRLGFNDIRGSYQDLVLHQLPPQIIINDITYFLTSEMLKIREDYNALSPRTPLPSDWPGPKVVLELARMAIPLFVFAATTCRFISDPAWSDPDGQLQRVLEYRNDDNNSGMGNLDATYRPVLDRLIVGSETAQQSLIDEFRLVVGSVILLEEPLSASSLSKLLDISRSIIDCRVMTLHSVLHVPATDDPIRILHLSFRDFLIDPQKKDWNRFWVDEKAVHKTIALSCLRLLSCHPNFHNDICGLQHPGSKRDDIPASVIRSKLPSAVRYACLYWTEHVVKGEIDLLNDAEVHTFLQIHFLHWLEALSLVEKVPESAVMVRRLQSINENLKGDHVSGFLYDADRFISTFKVIIARCPLQLYASALIFAPQTSIIRNTFQDDVPRWIRKLLPVRKHWNRCLHTLEAPGNTFDQICFTPDGKRIVASGSEKSDTIKSWDVSTGVENEVSSAEPDYPVAFNIDTGQEVLSVRIPGHSSDDFKAAALSPDKTLIATIREGNLALWSAKTGEKVLAIDAPLWDIEFVSFSPSGQSVTGVNKSGTVYMWDISNGAEQLKVQAGNNSNMVFSTDGKSFATISHRDLKLWDARTGSMIAVFSGHFQRIVCIAFSSNGDRIASGGLDGTIRIWDASHFTTVDAAVQLGPWAKAISMCLLSDGETAQIVCYMSDDSYLITTNVLGVVMGEAKITNGELFPRSGISPHSETLLTTDWTTNDVQIFNKTTGKIKRLSEGIVDHAVLGRSPNGVFLVIGKDEEIALVDTLNGKQINRLKLELAYHDERPQKNSATFSTDCQLVVFASWQSVRIWDIQTETIRVVTPHRVRFLEIHGVSSCGNEIVATCLDSNGKRFVGSWNSTPDAQVKKLWDALDTEIRNSSLTPDDKYLWTDRGFISLDKNPGTSTVHQKDQNLCLFVGREWITQAGEAILWLPPDYRPAIQAVNDDTVVLIRDGNWMRIQFSNEF